MFGFSLQKLIFTGLVIVVVIYGFKAIQRLQERRNAAENSSGGAGNGGTVKAAKRSAPVAQPEQGTEDMVACRACGTFVAASGTRSCGREDCPYPG